MSSSPPISTQELLMRYQGISDVACLSILDSSAYSLSYGPVLILSVVALKHMRARWSSAPSRSLKSLFIIVLTQLVVVTLRFLSIIAEDILYFKDTQLFITDGKIQKRKDFPVLKARVGLLVYESFSGVAVIILANAVLVWRAYTLYRDSFCIRCVLIFAWGIDFVFAMLHAAASMTVIALLFKNTLGDLAHLQRISMYTSLWMSFGLNMLATSLIAYRAWKFKNSLNIAGLNLKKSTVYIILARLVETGILLLGVQLLLAVVATTHNSGDPADPGYLAMSVILHLAEIIINTHPAAMSLVSADIVSKEDQGPEDIKVPDVSSTLSFRVADNRRLSEPPRSTVLSVHTEN
ncbi:hypothetical protein DL96DRAFT_1689351 [Flagelloscypha sp. PMI_526]|nr:hypothetical protein DL96DRAFT_1689351 [Flagelloscypha sp. PMI_526]